MTNKDQQDLMEAIREEMAREDVEIAKNAIKRLLRERAVLTQKLEELDSRINQAEEFVKTGKIHLVSGV